MKTELIQTQRTSLGQRQIQSLHLLQMGTVELMRFIREAAQENPLIDLPEDGDSLLRLLDKGRGVERQRPGEEDDRDWVYDDLDMDNPVADIYAVVGDSGGLELTVQMHLQEQLDRIALPEEERSLIKYLLEALDEDGYLRYSVHEIVKDTGIDSSTVAHALEIMRSLEPAGICARDLPECLALQLLRRGSAKERVCIARDYLNELACGHIGVIASALGIPEKEVLQAREEIRSLDPRPGSRFAREARPVYVTPDIYVDCLGGRFVVRPLEKENTLFTVNKYYLRLMKNTDDKETAEYLEKKMTQVEEIIQEIQRRGETLERLSQILVERQQEFFRKGPMALRPLSMAEVAAEMGVHISTVSRTVKDKYLQYSGGVLSLRTLFVRCTSSLAADGSSPSKTGNVALKEALKELIRGEPRRRPFSDQKLAELLTGMGFAISRRTVAKYRGELGILSAAGRKNL